MYHGYASLMRVEVVTNDNEKNDNGKATAVQLPSMLKVQLMRIAHSQ
jgi:hypothetical protein